MEESENVSLPGWIIALIIVGSVVGVALILLTLVLSIPSCRKKIFPYKRKEKRIQEDL